MNIAKVLVVDDDPDIAGICSLVLESEGYDTEIAGNGIDAYDFITTEGADVVLLDAMMPVMDGITVCEMVKRNPLTRNLPIVIMSASETMLRNALRSSADAIIQKPFDIDKLLLTIGRFAPAPS
ncbi:MAG: response regulator [Chloroflexota bacterium]